MSGVVYCGSMGDWPLLTDEQRMEGVERLVGAGLKVVVGTGAQNPMRAAALAAHAKKVGAGRADGDPARALARLLASRAIQPLRGILDAAVDVPA